MTRSQRIGVVLIVGLLAIAGAIWGAHEWYRSHLIAKFQPYVNEYVGLQAAPQAPPPGEPYVKGKVVPVDAGRMQIDRDVFFALPGYLQAGGPEEVGTVVLMRWQELEIDQYSNGGKALRVDCMLTVIDKETNAVIADGIYLKGGEPPDKIKESAKTGKGPKPVDKVVEYLTKLPRK